MHRDGDDVEMRDNAAYGTAHQIPSTNETQQTYEAVNVIAFYTSLSS